MDFVMDELAKSSVFDKGFRQVMLLFICQLLLGLEKEVIS
jgi:hypothetical protein